MRSAAPWVPGVIALGAVPTDLKKREIPNTVPVLMLVWAVVGTWLGWTGLTWTNAGLGFLLTLALAMLFAALKFGGGDVKLIATIGAAVGLAGSLLALFWIAIMGGVFAVIASARGQKDFAYAPAIALGLLAFAAQRVFFGR